MNKEKDFDLGMLKAAIRKYSMDFTGGLLFGVVLGVIPAILIAGIVFITRIDSPLSFANAPIRTYLMSMSEVALALVAISFVIAFLVQREKIREPWVDFFSLFLGIELIISFLVSIADIVTKAVGYKISLLGITLWIVYILLATAVILFFKKILKEEKATNSILSSDI